MPEDSEVKENKLEKILEISRDTFDCVAYGSMIISPLVYRVADSFGKNLPHSGEIFLGTTLAVGISVNRYAVTDNFNPVPGFVGGIIVCPLILTALYHTGRAIGFGLDKIIS